MKKQTRFNLLTTLVKAILSGAAVAGLYLAWNAGYLDRGRLPEPKPTPIPVAIEKESRTTMPPLENGIVGALPPEEPPTVFDDEINLVDNSPDPALVRRQDTENPHAAPQSLLGFAHRLAGLMVEALESEAAAPPVFNQLEQCAGDRQGKEIVQTRLICLANASRLAQQYPDLLGSRYKALANKVPSLIGMLEMTGL